MNLDAFLKPTEGGDSLLSRLLSCPELREGVRNLTKIVDRFSDRPEAVNECLLKAHSLGYITKDKTRQWHLTEKGSLLVGNEKGQRDETKENEAETPDPLEIPEVPEIPEEDWPEVMEAFEEMDRSGFRVFQRERHLRRGDA